MLKTAALILAILVVSISMLPLAAASGSLTLSDFVEQNFVALTLVVLIPLVMPWME